MTNMKVQSFIEVTKNIWEVKYKKGWGGGRDFIFEDFLKKYKTKLGPKILDIGSGEGRHVMLLAKAGFDVVGLELTEAGNIAANKQLKNNNLQATLVLGDAHSLPFIDQYFDSVVSIQVFQFNDWSGADFCFSEASRVLKMAGLFFLRVKSTSAEVPEGNKLIEDDWGATYKTPDNNKAHFFTEDELISLGKKHNLKIVDGLLDATNDNKNGQWNVVFQKIEEK